MVDVDKKGNCVRRSVCKAEGAPLYKVWKLPLVTSDF